MSIPLVDTWVCSCIKLLIENDYRGGGPQEGFNGMFWKYLKLATDELIKKISRFVE